MGNDIPSLMGADEILARISELEALLTIHLPAETRVVIQARIRELRQGFVERSLLPQ